MVRQIERAHIRSDTTIRKQSMPKADVRALRRSLADITPENSAPQLQSPLFVALPSELRNLIFEYAVSQSIDSEACSRETQNARLRPCHELRPVTHTALLRTCRLVYYETRAIPLRSATHHVYGDQATSYNYEDWDHYLFHLSSQSGQHLHHLHVTDWRIPKFERYLKQHLHWRKITWTVCASEWDMRSEWEPESVYADVISNRLSQVLFPNACREVNLEFETLQKSPNRKDPGEEKRLRQVFNCVSTQCREIQLARCDGSKIELDEEYSMDYTWEGESWKTGDWQNGPGGYVSAPYHVVRLCWRERVSERKYMHYDRWDCLRSDKNKPVPVGDASGDEPEAQANNESQ